MSSPIAPQLVDPEPMVDPKVALTRVFDDALTSVQIITSAQYDANGGHYDLVSGSSHVLPAWLVEELVREGIGSRS